MNTDVPIKPCVGLICIRYRQLQGPSPVAVAGRRHHRQKGIPTALPILRQSEESNHSSKSSPSPFANVQNGRDTFASTLQAEGTFNSSMGSNEGTSNRPPNHKKPTHCNQNATAPYVCLA